MTLAKQLLIMFVSVMVASVIIGSCWSRVDPVGWRQMQHIHSNGVETWNDEDP